jgi:hypothetical protein
MSVKLGLLHGKKERRLRMLENMVLRKIFEPMKKRVRGGC